MKLSAKVVDTTLFNNASRMLHVAFVEYELDALRGRHHHESRVGPMQSTSKKDHTNFFNEA